MRKVVVHSAGGYEKLKLEEHADPHVGPGDVEIEVEAAGVNFADCVVRMGLYPSARDYVGWPITPGFECAGRVARVGRDAQRFAPGDEVMALVRFGGYATRVVAPEHQVFEKPSILSMSEAAAFLVVHITAYYALLELCRLRPRMKVLVHSAAGGVGGALLQIGKIQGCETVGIVGKSHKVGDAKRLGASHVIDKSEEKWWLAARRLSPEGYDVVLDANGAETLRKSYRLLGPTGRLIVYGFHTMLRRGSSGRPPWLRLAANLVRTPLFSPLEMTNANKGVLGFNLSYLFDKRELMEEGTAALFGWLASGELVMPKVEEIPLEKVAEAHRLLESGDTTGKLVLRM